jgi:hypothetical protein
MTLCDGGGIGWCAVADLDAARRGPLVGFLIALANGRPHFALTTEHFFDLDCLGPYHGQDLFDWRDDYPVDDPDPEPQDREKQVVKAFNEYVERVGTDYEQKYRAPWMDRPD